MGLQSSSYQALQKLQTRLQIRATQSTQMTASHAVPTHQSHPKLCRDQSVPSHLAVKLTDNGSIPIPNQFRGPDRRCYSGGTWHLSRLPLRSIERRKRPFAIFQKKRRIPLYLDSYSELSRQKAKGLIRRTASFVDDTRAPERPRQGRQDPPT
jgi:hypothetical protein